MPYYLGIDGGGTKTTCAVGDESQTLGTATAGPSNIVRVGEARARESLHQAVSQACSAAGIAPTQVARTCVGGSGAARPELGAIIRRMLSGLLPAPVDVVGDMEIALEAAFGTGPGVIVIAGTGSIAYGRNRDGSTARAGGWGFAIGDEGSAHWIGRAAVSAVLRASDEDHETGQDRHSEFASALCKVWGVSSLLDLARVANSVPPPDFAALFPAVAASKDALAAHVLSLAGAELARTCSVVVRRLFRSHEVSSHEVSNQEVSPYETRGHELEGVPVAMIGGVFRYSSLTREDFCNALRRIETRVKISPQVVEPVEGALRMARRAAGA